jgi:hypothetical protein
VPTVASFLGISAHAELSVLLADASCRVWRHVLDGVTATCLMSYLAALVGFPLYAVQFCSITSGCAWDVLAAG